MKVTVFKDFSDTKRPQHVEFSAVIKQLSSPKQSFIDLVESIRSEKDDKKRKVLKAKLPCILFSGEFSERNDKSLIQHSGLAVVDFDHVGDVMVLKDKLKLIDYVSAAFTSPSGDGVKAVVSIPRSIDFHRENYDAMMEDLEGRLNIPKEKFDKTSKNESRICYASYDPDTYYNSNPKCFTKLKKVKVVHVDYNKINIAVNMIRLAHDGEKHSTLLKAAKLMGGYIASGMIEELFATQVLETEISNKNISDFKGAKKTIQDGLAYGKTMPIYETEEIESGATVGFLRIKLQSPSRRYEFLTDNSEDRADIMRYRTGGFKMGLTTGHIELDKYFRFKEGEFNVMLGHANVGKSFFMWWLMAVSSRLHGWKWIVYSTENKIRQIKKKLIEFYTQQTIFEMKDDVYQDGLDWVDEMFYFIRIDKAYSAVELIDFAKVLIEEKEFKGFLIDPYNSLSIDKELWKEVGSSRHEYDYAVSSMFVSFCDKNNLSIYLNAHAVSQALRNKHPKARMKEEPHRYEGHPMPPEGADIEGGGKFVNRVTGFFMVIHRYIYHEDDWGITRVEIKKCKDTETGGMQTRYEKPVEFVLKGNLNYFAEKWHPTNPIPYKGALGDRSQESLQLGEPTYTQPISVENGDVFGRKNVDLPSNDDFEPFD
jgi:hypothetical protein